MITIGIIYISTGLYNRFWEGFYESVNSNFCVDANKNFYLFTDDKDMVARKLPDNVFPQLIEDRGWVLNVMRRSEFFLSIEEKLKENDFVFNLNSNYRAIAPIYSGEILPEDSNDGVSALCFDFYIGQNPDNFAYDRNPNSSAYIPLGSGKYYFQGGFYGGCTTEFLNMSRHIKELTEIDISRKIVPRFHDESYLNRYLLNHNPRIIGTLYAVAEQWNPTADSKGLLLDKDKWFSKNELENIKSLHTEPTLSFLIDDNLRSQPIAIINLQGGLGNQIFQYAMMVQLRKDFPNRRFYLNRSTLQMLECHQGYQLDYIFGVDSDMVVPENIIGQIAKIPSRYVRRIDEPLFCGYTPIKDSTHPVWLISGYRQSEKYFDDSVRENLIFDYTKLNEESKDLLEVIRKDKASVAIHIRRGDYVRDIRTYNLMGGICTKEYYSEAIKQFDADSNYYVFSDDIEWCKKNW